MIRIKIPTKLEIKKLGPLVDELISSHKELPWVDDYQEVHKKVALEFLSGEGKAIFIAKKGEEIVGYVAGSITSYGPLQGNKQMGLINIIAVLPAYRRKGIGKKLCMKMIEWFSKHKIEEVTLFNSVKNKQSKAFWESCGFEVFLEQRRKRL